jgi:hypothetical protein
MHMRMQGEHDMVQCKVTNFYVVYSTQSSVASIHTKASVRTQ